MFEKCAGCGSRILGGGVRSGSGTWCSEDCLKKSVCNVVEQVIPSDMISSSVQSTFLGACPHCGGPGPIDVFTATKLTGMLVMFTITRPQKICCARCARVQRLQAATHNLFLGWWGVKCGIINLFVLPYQIGAAILTRPPRQPSAALIQAVKLGLSEALSQSHATGATGAEREGSQSLPGTQ